MRHTRSICLALLLFLIINLIVFPVKADHNGTCGDAATWTLSDSGVLTISGSGAIKNYIYEGYETWPNLLKAPWRKYASQITHIVIEQGITSIGDNAFCELPNVQTVSLPNSLTHIGQAAFYNANSLNNVTIPNSVTSIKKSAFAGCDSLTNISLPSGLSVLPGSMFKGCVSLRTVILPSSITIIQASAFAYCRQLTNLTIPENVTVIEANAFNSCTSLTTLNLPNGLVEIKPSAFEYSGLTRIIIPQSVNHIYTYAFGSCNNLKHIEFKGNAPSFNSHVFSGITATAYYPIGNESWTETVRQDYNGTITWISCCPNGHTWDQWETQREPTCSVAGLNVRSCTKCDMTEEQSISKAAHQYIKSTTPPTCKDDGYTTHTCQVCNNSYTDNITPKGPHLFEEWITIKEATCLEAGIRQHTCTVCQLQESEETDIGDHTYQDTVTAPSCTQEGFTTHVCALCGYTITDTHTEKIPHAYGEWEDISFATWFTEGTQERKCADCPATETKVIPQWPIEGFIIIIAVIVIIPSTIITITILKKKKTVK